MKLLRILAPAGVALVAIAGADTSVTAQATRELGWNFTARLTTVFTSGNSESNTFGVGTTIQRIGASNTLKIEMGALRTDSGLRTRRAIGTSQNFRVEEETVWEKTAEAYFFRSRYDFSVGGKFVVFAGLDWLRNTFAGIDSRFLIAAGSGNVWSDTDRFRFKTDYGLTYTFQQDVVENPFTKTKFPGVRISYDLMRQLTTSTKFESGLITDFNIDNTDDVRADFTNALSISINQSLAFKPGLQLSWRNDPALTEIDLVDQTGNPLGERVLVPLEKLDSFLTIALVLTL